MFIGFSGFGDRKIAPKRLPPGKLPPPDNCPRQTAPALITHTHTRIRTRTRTHTQFAGKFFLGRSPPDKFEARRLPPKYCPGDDYLHINTTKDDCPLLFPNNSGGYIEHAFFIQVIYSHNKYRKIH